MVGARGDLARLLIAAAAATLAGLLTPVATGAILGIERGTLCPEADADEGTRAEAIAAWRRWRDARNR
jgi:hypothetical protein